MSESDTEYEIKHMDTAYEPYVDPFPQIGDEFLTVTLRPEHHGDTARQQHKNHISKLIKILNNTCTRYYGVTELTNSGNVHYHIAIKTKKTLAETDPKYILDYKCILMDQLKGQKFGFYDIRPNKINDADQIKTYFMKDIPKTWSVINPRAKPKIDIIFHYLEPARVKVKYNIPDYL